MEYNFGMNDDNNAMVMMLELNPESADMMGYEWWKDVIFDKEAPVETMKDIVDLKEKGFVFGKCATKDGESNNFIGVYMKKASH